MELENFKYNLESLKKCDQYWDEMKPVIGGRQCSKCRKKIVDFSNMTFSDIAVYMSESNEPVCGFYRQEQLKQESLSNSKLPFVFTLTTLMVTGTASKAEKYQQGIEQHVNNLTSSNDKYSIPILAVRQPVNDTVYVQGKVLYYDTTKKANLQIPYAAIVVKGTKTGVSATNNGEFLLRYSPSEGTDKIQLVISSIGFKSKEVEVALNQQKQVDLGDILLDQASVIEFYVITKKRSKLNKLWRKTTKPFRSQ